MVLPISTARGGRQVGRSTDPFHTVLRRPGSASGRMSEQPAVVDDAISFAVRSTSDTIGSTDDDPRADSSERRSGKAPAPGSSRRRLVDDQRGIVRQRLRMPSAVSCRLNIRRAAFACVGQIDQAEELADPAPAAPPPGP